jgi:hypothetical protein
MLEKYEICRGLFHRLDWSLWITGTPAQKLGLLPNAQEHILKQEDGKNRLLKAVSDLSKAFALAVPHDEAMRIRDDVGFFQAVRSVLAKSASQQQRPEYAVDNAIRQIVSRAVWSGEVVDIFAAAGLKKPEQHHVTPKYFGLNDPTTVPLNTAYHQWITNLFRALKPHGEGPISPVEAEQIKRIVYKKFPLPPEGCEP